MPNQLHRLSGKEVISIFKKFNFVIVRQRGSHVVLTRQDSNKKQVLVVPNHKEIDRGTLHEIFKQAIRFIPETDLREYFYSK